MHLYVPCHGDILDLTYNESPYGRSYIHMESHHYVIFGVLLIVFS